MPAPWTEQFIGLNDRRIAHWFAAFEIERTIVEAAGGRVIVQRAADQDERAALLRDAQCVLVSSAPNTKLPAAVVTTAQLYAADDDPVAGLPAIEALVRTWTWRRPPPNVLFVQVPVTV